MLTVRRVLAVKWENVSDEKLFINQSATLYSKYYLAQIYVHRPFIPSPRKPSPLSFPSLAICTNAARSCIHVLDVQYKRTGMPLFSNQVRAPLLASKRGRGWLWLMRARARRWRCSRRESCCS